MPNYLTEDDGMQYLVLPSSNSRVLVEDEHQPYLHDIDVDMLRTAEEKILARIAQYPENSGIYLSKDDNGYLCLCVEVIVKLEPAEVPTDSEFEERGCGIDHEHKFFSEPITK